MRNSRGGALRRAFEKLQGVGWTIGDQCVVSAANFLTIYLFARHLDTSHFGTFMLAYVGLQLLTSMQSALLTQPHNVLAAALPQKEYRRFTAAVLVMQIGGALAAAMLLALAGWLVWRFYSPATGSVLLALAMATAPWLAQEFVRRVLYTRGESRAAAKNDFVTYGLQFLGALVVALLWANAASPEIALAVLGASSLASASNRTSSLRSRAPGTKSGTSASGSPGRTRLSGSAGRATRGSLGCCWGRNRWVSTARRLISRM
jgi:O-antigen/teichoic acid export membrane protein